MLFGVPFGLAAQSILEIPTAAPGVHIAYGSGEFQFGELSLPDGEGPHPVAIVIHGGYWRARYDLRHIGHFCAALAKAGIAAWSLEYRRIGNPGGGFPGTFDDIRAGAMHLDRIAKERALDLRRVIATGHSAGGHLVLWLAIGQNNAETVLARRQAARTRRAAASSRPRRANISSCLTFRSPISL